MLLVFGVGVLWFLVIVLRGGGHPLGLEPDLDLCDVLDPAVWSELPTANSEAIIRIPTNAAGASNYCALELDPVTSGNRFERIARGDDAARVREIASVMVVTRAALYRQNPAGSTKDFTEMWSSELQADGWQRVPLEGPWRYSELFTGKSGKHGILIEDDGIMIWITASGTDPEGLVRFAKSITLDLRNVN